MLKTFRKYKRSVFGVVGVGLIALSMGGFGINLASNQSKANYAIKVGDQEISYDEFNQMRQEIDQRYRKMLGDNYAQTLKAFNINVAQQVIDSAINNNLLNQFASQMGLDGSTNALRQMIQNELFQGKFDGDRYSQYLASQGLSEVQFENKLRQDIARQQLIDLFNDASKASTKETKAMMARDKTRYSFVTLNVDIDEVKKTVTEPSAEEVSKYYDDNLTEFQTEAQVDYNYTILEPSDFIEKVAYTQDDIELEYSDNSGSYQTKPEVKLSQIVLRFAENATTEQKATTKNKAIELSEKIKNGEKFEELAKSFSQDTASALQAGDAGWLTKDALPAPVASKAFSIAPGVVSPIIETSSGIYLIRVEDKKGPILKPLEEVKEQIIKKIQLREAPSVLALQSQELHDEWQKSNKPLIDFCKEKNLPQPKSVQKQTKSQSPEATLKNLNSEILSSRDSKQQMLEVDEKQVFVQVSALREEGVEPLESAKTKIGELLKAKLAKVQAQAKAQQILESIQKAEIPNLKEAASKYSLKAEELLDLTAANAKGVLAEESVRNKVFNFTSAPQKASEVFSIPTGFALVELTDIKLPDQKELESGLAEMQKGLSRELSEYALNSFVSKLKGQTAIDVKPQVLND